MEKIRGANSGDGGKILEREKNRERENPNPRISRWCIEEEQVWEDEVARQIKIRLASKRAGFVSGETMTLTPSRHIRSHILPLGYRVHVRVQWALTIPWDPEGCFRNLLR
ncbi:hypothetical protein H6P81_005132 [Aristolochia fimbriata]|uniref:Uncharacterized protein n=1 Tax=Aristolochia fimbriata TaxID=158543 RepID=A0AAV7ETR9_ARIFI|nr:hypothetical protein H6P81_005132 [Aristolochia fimbriata]